MDGGTSHGLRGLKILMVFHLTSPKQQKKYPSMQAMLFVLGSERQEDTLPRGWFLFWRNKGMFLTPQSIRLGWFSVKQVKEIHGMTSHKL